MKKPPLPKCPLCSSSSQVARVGVAGDQFICRRAGCGLFDDDPDEGGDYFENPSRRIELQETRRERRRTGR